MTGKSQPGHSSPDKHVVLHFRQADLCRQDGTQTRDRAKQLHADFDSISFKYYEFRAFGTTYRDQRIDLL